MQQSAGLDFFSDGLLRWQDIFRPLAEAAGAPRPHTLVRWFDTNTFFREPDLSRPLTPVKPGAAPLPDPTVPKPRVATLPSPYMFSRAATFAGDRNRLMVDLSRQVLRPVIDAAVGAGARVIHLQEPWLAYTGIGAADWGPFEEALKSMHNGLPATLVLHVYFGDAAPHLERLRRLPVDAIGVDLVETDAGALAGQWDKDLVIGCMNGRSSILESVDAIVGVARQIGATAHPRNLYLTSGSDLQFLPATVASQKVARLGEAARRLKELVSV